MDKAFLILNIIISTASGSKIICLISETDCSRISNNWTLVCQLNYTIVKYRLTTLIEHTLGYSAISSTAQKLLG